MTTNPEPMAIAISQISSYRARVSSTTAASRLSTAVITEAKTKPPAAAAAAARCGTGHPRPARAEQPLGVTQLGKHQHRGQEPDRRP